MAKGQQTVIITAGDSRYFEFLASCIESINAARPRSSYALAVMDVGCTAQQRGWLEAHVDVCCEPAWHFEFANRSELPGYLRGLLARPFLRDYFPGFETYVWIDADAWVQEWRAIELFCAGARMRRGLAVVPEIDRCSWRQYGGLPEYWQAVAGWYAAQFGPGVGDRLCSYPMLNAGVFGLDAAAPHWNEWRSAIARALQWRCGIMTDQLALNVIVYMQGLLEKTELLPATCNWTCHNGFPMWDEHQRRMVEPYLPRAPIGIVHLTTRDKSPIRPIRTTDNRQIPARVMFPAGPIGQPSAGLAPAQDAASGNLAAQCREAFERGVRFHQSGELVQARAELEQVLRINPRHEYALHLLGVERLQQGNPQEAIGLIDQAIAINAQVAAFHSNRCAALAAMRRHEEAVVACRRALQLEPNSIELRLQLSHVLTQAEHTAEAESLLRALVQQHPEHADAYKALGRILMRDAARFGEAATALRRSLECGPASASTWNELGYIYKNLGRSEESVEAFRAAVDLEPGHAGAFNNLSVALRSLGRLSEAAEASRRAIELNPQMAEAYTNLGVVLHDVGRIEEAVASYRRALEIKPSYSSAHSRLLYATQYRPGITADELKQTHQEFDRRHGAEFQGRWHAANRAPQRTRPLTVGFVADGLAQHPVGYFLVGLLENLDPADFQIVCYSDRPRRDSHSERIRRSCAHWRDILQVDNGSLANQIRQDGVDILFDLCGHAGGHRMLLFARKPAPVQVTWMGYVGTTGLAAMDFLLADRFHVPPGTESLYCETVVRLPHGYVCYAPPAYAPDVSALPALQRGTVTFGNFGQPAKINAAVVAAWSALLRRVPGSQLMLQYKGWSDPALSGSFRGLFEQHGVDPRRIQMSGKTDHEQLLSRYAHIDIALDTFPYSGGVTTCEALWMGVPVITVPGDTFASRHSLSHLTNARLESMVASSVEDYVEKGVRLAGDLESLVGLRARMRPQVASSPLCDARRFAEHWGELMQRIWREKCAATG